MGYEVGEQEEEPVSVAAHEVGIRDVHGDGIPNGTGNLMGMGINTELGMGMGGNGKPPQWEWELPALPWNLFPKVLCCLGECVSCDELIKLLVLFLPDADYRNVITPNVPSA